MALQPVFVVAVVNFFFSLFFAYEAMCPWFILLFFFSSSGGLGIIRHEYCVLKYCTEQYKHRKYMID